MTPPSHTHLIDDALWTRSLTLDQARQLPGQTLEFFFGDQHGHTHVAPLRVTAVQERSPDASGMQQFSLELLGPVAPRLPDQSYRARHADAGEFVIFIAALAQTPEGIAYLASFSQNLAPAGAA